MLHGGATQQAANSILERKNQIVALEAEARSIREKLSTLTTTREEAVAGIEAAQVRLDEAREEKQNATIQVSTLRGQLTVLDRELQDAEKKSQSFDWERGNIEARHREAAEKLGMLESETQAALGQIEELQGRRSGAQSDLEAVARAGKRDRERSQ